MKENLEKIKMAVISGAAHALKYKELNPRMSEEDVIRYISAQTNIIISKIDNKFS